MKEFTFGFRLAAILGSSFSTTFQKAQKNIAETKQELKSYQDTWKGVYKAQQQGIISTGSAANAYEKLLSKAEKLPALQEKYARLATSSIQSWAHFDLAKIWINTLVQLSDKAINFESSMADVRKVVDFDTPQQFKQMSNDLLNLTAIIPMTADGLANIAAAGGQSGIAKAELAGFAADAAKMGIAFDVTADNAGEMMAKWRTAFKMGQTQVVSLADKINYLGNTTAASAPLISDVVTRIGPLGAVGGVAAGEIAALGASMVGTGVPSEIAATGIKNMILAMTSGESATKSQVLAFEKLGFSAENMAQRMQTDARGAILDLFNALEKVAPEQRASIMQNIFGKESIGAIAPLLSNLDQLKKNFASVGDASKYAGSMEAEFAARSDTTVNKMQLMKNRMDKAQIQMTTGLLPVITLGSEYLGKLATTLGDVTEKYPGLTGGVIAFGLGLGGLYITVNFVTGAFNTYKAAIVGYELIMQSMTNSTVLFSAKTKAMAFFTKLATGAQWLLNASLWGCPVLVIAGAFAVAGYIIYKEWDRIKTFFTNLWESPEVALQQFIDGIYSRFGGAIDWIYEKWQSISNFLSTPIFGKVNIATEGTGGGGIAQNATGGIYSRGAFLTTFAENDGESAIPHTPNRRNINLLAATNAIMGNPLGGGNITAAFAPQITVQGGTGAEIGDIDHIMSQKMREFEEMLKRVAAQQRRLSYA